VLLPKLILYDEPTTGLDPITSASIADLILSLQVDLHVASIVVTHDLPAAFTLSDKVIVLESGSKIYDGPIEELQATQHDHLDEFLSSATLDRSRREGILAKKTITVIQ
jgi:phospholipid/cholesterol/gamma-HCH transport system ATP-binding protein